MKSLAVGTVIGFIAQLMVVHLHQYHRGHGFESVEA